MEDEQLVEIRKAVVALLPELMKVEGIWQHWNLSPYKELKWVQHYPLAYAAECKLLKKRERDKILIDLKNERLSRLWRRQ